MNRWFVLLIAIVAGAAGWLLRSTTFNQSPITEAAHRKFDQHLKKIIATAESMPANRYAYAPSDNGRYFLDIAQQVAMDASQRCAHLLNVRTPDFSRALKALQPEEPLPRLPPDALPKEFKNSAVELLKGSMDTCDKAFGLLNDSKLHELATAHGDQKATKAELLMDMLADVAKAENEMDMYLELNRTATPNPPSS